MTDAPLRLVAFDVSPDTVKSFQTQLPRTEAGRPIQWELVPDRARLAAAANRADVAVVGAHGDAAVPLRLLGDLWRQRPELPVVFVLGQQASASGPGVTALGDGVFMVEADVDDNAFVRFIAKGRGDGWHPSGSEAERELAHLSAVCGPAPLRSASRVLGGHPLKDAAPDRFSAIIRDYAELLDATLVVRTREVEDTTAESLQAIADRLGTLNAGPRDVIDVHRQAIAERIKGQSPQRAKAYIAEGRLVLVQLMGYLLSFYRSLSWGARRTAKTRNRP